MSRLKRSALTAVSGLAWSTTVILAAFFTTPILLRCLGSERYGLFRVAVDWLGYVTILEFGIGGALISVFSRALGTGHRAGVAAGVRAGMKAHLLIMPSMLAFGGLLGWMMPQLVRAPKALSGELQAGCGVYLIGLLLMPLASFRPLAESEQRGYIVHLANFAQTLTAIGLSVAFAVAGWGLVGQFLGLVAGVLIFHGTLAWDGLRRHPEVIWGPADVAPPLWALSWPNLLFNLSGRLSLFTDNILVAAYLGPVSVTSFILTQRLIQTAGTQAAGIGAAGWAGLVDLHYRGEHEAFTHRLTQLTRVTGIIGATLLVPLGVWNREVIGLWVGPDRFAGSVVTWLSVADAWGLAVFGLWGWPLAATGRIRMLLPVQIVGVVVNLAVSLTGTAMLGMPGPLLGTAVTLTGVHWWWLMLLLRREFGVSGRRLFWAAVQPGLVAVAFGVMLSALAGISPSSPPDWPRWARWASLMGRMGGSSIVYLGLSWLLVVPNTDRAEWVSRFRQWISLGQTHAKAKN